MQVQQRFDQPASRCGSARIAVHFSVVAAMPPDPTLAQALNADARQANSGSPWWTLTLELRREGL
jgi:hypothetical protein